MADKAATDAWNRWRKANPTLLHPDLSGADLAKADLTGAHLARVNLTGAYIQ